MKLIGSLALLCLLCLATPVNALVMRGLVSEVSDGKTVVFITSNQKMTVTLQGVDAPDLTQDYGEVARQHLASLVLGKEISIELVGLNPGRIMGKVVCNEMDIGLQVIRDGVAWYDPVNGESLNDLERKVYVAASKPPEASNADCGRMVRPCHRGNGDELRRPGRQISQWPGVIALRGGV